MDSTAIIFTFAVVFIIAAVVLGIIGYLRKGGGHLNVEKYRSKWLAIEQSFRRDNPEAMLLAVLNADKLVDQALRDRGIGGATMGERLKMARKLWTRSDTVWAAHKLRNYIAHETDAKVSYDQARRALSGYKQALKDLGAI